LNAERQTTRIVEYFIQDKKETAAFYNEKERTREEAQRTREEAQRTREEAMLNELKISREETRECHAKIDEYQQQILAATKKPKMQNVFNIGVYLNTDCGDAISLADFNKSIKVDYEDFIAFPTLGFVGGYSAIIIKNFDKLGANRRPIQCSSVQNRTMHVKTRTGWEVDKPRPPKPGNPFVKYNHICTMLNAAVVATMHYMSRWKRDNPEYGDSGSPVSDEYQKLVRILQNLDSNTLDSYGKIVVKVARYTSLMKLKKMRLSIGM
jgi:hypothetical protein